MRAKSPNTTRATIVMMVTMGRLIAKSEMNMRRRCYGGRWGVGRENAFRDARRRASTENFNEAVPRERHAGSARLIIRNARQISTRAPISMTWFGGSPKKSAALAALFEK